MIKAIINTYYYFRAPKYYFWQWADKGEVAEWINGATICYRDDLIDVLKNLSAKKLPSLSSILLLLSACKKAFTEQEELLLRQQNRFEGKGLEALLDETIIFLHIVNRLPEELKTGTARMILIHEVFYDAQLFYSGMNVKDALDELNSGRIDQLVIEAGEPITKEQFTSDLLFFSNAIKNYPDTGRLALKLKTGLDKLPVPANIILPESPTPDLLDQLAEDARTVGISRLTRRLVAALNIPMHLSSSGDQSYGGITDITNRGSYDKLLLSELAYDNDLLMARLVNNEALYFRREEPPNNPKRQRTILLDTTLKMWGIPRVFGVSAALAFSRNNKHNEIIECYALGGESVSEIKLDTKEGIIGSLEKVDHSLHCGKALQQAIKEFSTTEYNEFVFITDEKIFNNPSFHAAISEVKGSIGFIVTVSREGKMMFYECKRGRTKLLSDAKFDLEELLFAAPKKISSKIDPVVGDLPAFLSQRPAPLLFPRVRIKLKYDRLFDMGHAGIIVINESQRVLHIPEKAKGAYELMGYIEKGSYFFGCEETGILHIIVNNFQRKFLKVYHINTKNNTYTEKNISDEIHYAKEIVFQKGKFYIRSDYASFCYDCDLCEVIDKREYVGFASIFNSVFNNPTELSELAKHVQPYDSAMYKIREIFISNEEKLVIGNYTLELTWNDHNIRINENIKKEEGSHYSTETPMIRNVFRSKSIKLITRKWEDGSEAVIDTRGLLHLKSSNKLIPEITLVLVTGRNTACWASDGTVAGDKYFIDKDYTNVIPITGFYNRYIQAFITKIIHS